MLNMKKLNQAPAPAAAEKKQRLKWLFRQGGKFSALLPAPAINETLYKDMLDETFRLIKKYNPTWPMLTTESENLSLMEQYSWVSDLGSDRLN
jgi:hypothetical protein